MVGVVGGVVGVVRYLLSPADVSQSVELREILEEVVDDFSVIALPQLSVHGLQLSIYLFLSYGSNID